MATAADITFMEVVREACLSRDRFHGVDRSCRRHRTMRLQSYRCRVALGIEAGNDRIKDIEREIVDGPNLPRSQMGRRWRRVLDSQQ